MKKYAQNYTSRDSKMPMFSAFLYQNYLIFLFSSNDKYMLSQYFDIKYQIYHQILTNISNSCEI